MKKPNRRPTLRAHRLNLWRSLTQTLKLERDIEELFGWSCAPDPMLDTIERLERQLFGLKEATLRKLAPAERR